MNVETPIVAGTGVNAFSPRVAKVADNIGVVAWSDGSAINGKVVTATASPLTLGSEQELQSDGDFFDLQRVGSLERLAMVYREDSTVQQKAKTIDRSGNTLTPNSPSSNISSASGLMAADVSEAGTQIVYGHVSDGIFKLSIAGTSVSFSDFEGISPFDICFGFRLLESTRFLCMYTDHLATPDLWFVIANTGIGISLGTALDSGLNINRSAMQSMASCCLARLTDSKSVAVAIDADPSPDELKTFIINNTLSTITSFGTPLQVASGAALAAVCRRSDDNFWVFFEDGSDLSVQLFSVSGSDITAGDKVSFTDTVNWMGGAVMVSDNVGLIGWEDNSGNVKVARVTFGGENRLWIYKGTINPTTGDVSWISRGVKTA